MQATKSLIIITLILGFVLPSAGAEVVMGPGDNEGAEEDGKSANKSVEDGAKGKTAGSLEDSDPSLALFAKLGIRVIPRSLDGVGVNGGFDAQELVEDLISRGEHNEEVIFERVKNERSVVIDHLVIDLSRQRLFLMNGEAEILEEFPVSTGVRGYDTPPGEYQIVNKATYAYSKKYEADMYHWMGLTRNGDYGLHALKGSGYERRLGRRASHGCIRLSRRDARMLFEILPIGMPVKIVTQLAEPRYFEPVTDETLKSMIRDLLGEAPREVFF